MSSTTVKQYRRFERILPLLAVLFVVDVLAVFQNYWWRDTFTSVYWSLAIITLINILFPNRHWSYRIPFDLLIGIFITFRVTWHRQPELVEHFSERLYVIHPFLEIVLAVIIILFLLERYVISKQRLINAFAVGLLILCIRDSFSPLRLWLNIACLVVLFLVWHTLLHYRSLDRVTLAKLFKRPLSLITPFIAILLSITIVGFSLPHGPPLLEDPYALWLKSRGEKVPAFIGDKGYGLYNSRNTLLTTSGYSRDSSLLGGGFNYDYTPVMQVETTHKGYLRGETRGIYDGKGWIQRDDLSLFEPVVVGKILPTSDEDKATYVEVNQTITLLSDHHYSVLFANGIPDQLQTITYNQSKGNSEITILETLPTGTISNDFVWESPSYSVVAATLDELPQLNQYSIVSNTIITDIEGLKEASASFSQKKLNQPYYSQYLSIPDVVPERVYELAASVTSAAANDYERALLLEQHLRYNYRYTNTPDLSRLSGQSDDFVDQFLFELLEGYCDYFSTAMVIMARSLGMPARWVKGFTSGINEQEQMLLNSNPYLAEDYEPATSGTFTIRNADAHSWVEIYFEGYGWIPFEPTPGFNMPQQFGEEEAENILQSLLPSFPPVADANQTADDSTSFFTESQVRMIVWTSLSLLFIIFIATLIYYRQALLIQWRNLRYITYTNNQKIGEVTMKLLKQGQKKGLPVRKTSTMREILLEWKQYYPAASEALDELLSMFELASYSNGVISDEQVERARIAVDSIRQHWKT